MDGMGDRPIKELNNQTPLQAAKTPNMDKMAERGITGIMDSIAPGVIPGSDTAHLSILGYDPYEVYTGRGPFEASGVGVEVIPGDIAFRCNFSTSDENGIITDRRAGRVREGTDKLVETLNTMKIEGYEDIQIIFKESTGHRAVLVLRGEGLSGKVSDADPKVEGNKPKEVVPLDDTPEAQKTADILNKVVPKTYEMIKDHPVNLERIENGEPPANIVIPRGAGAVPSVPSINEKYGVNSACIAETGLIMGIGRFAGMDIIEMEDVTGGVDTNLYNIRDTILDQVKNSDHDFFFLRSQLQRIRREIRSTQSRIKERIGAALRAPENQKYFQEAIVTLRDERYVIPVKAEYRRFFPGIVHDQSATGATLFVEPMGVVQANNELKELEAKEKKEIERILFALSAEAAGFSEAILWDYDILVHLDLIFARGELSYQMDAARPEIRTDGSVSLRRARHPLLDPAKAVPIDIEVGRSFDTLVITGPNTGGKTVSLKTLGLLCLMAQCGLHIPAGDRSAVSVFTGILADIGDEQSIEQSLSTFSAHMKTIVNILDEADGDSLVLFDELGAGTDPVEGAALAIAVIEHVRARGAKVAATTHYAELKRRFAPPISSSSASPASPTPSPSPRGSASTRASSRRRSSRWTRRASASRTC